MPKEFKDAHIQKKREEKKTPSGYKIRASASL
jgi:hypothetical protein